MKTKTKTADLTKSRIRASAITELTWRGHDVWIQNNLAVRKRKFIGRLGVPDIIGITKDGRWVVCEVKTINDRLSDDQVKFLNQVKQAGGLAYTACQSATGQVEIKEWEIQKL